MRIVRIATLLPLLVFLLVFMHPVSPASQSRSLTELVSVQAGLFQDRVCRVTRLDFAIDRKVYSGNRAIPYFVIALALANLAALGCCQDFLEFSGVVSHMNLMQLADMQ